MKTAKGYEQQLLEWRWHQLRFRKKYKDTPAGFLDQETEKQAFYQWKEDVEAFRKSQEHKILSKSTNLPHEPFVGREDLLSQIRSAIEVKTGPVILYGIGGIGKSALARAYARTFRDDYDHILVLPFLNSMQSLIVDDFEIKISNLQYSVKRYGNQRKYFQIKMDILCQIARKKRILLIIDDCNVKHDRNMKAVFSLPCDILVTTRRNPIIWGLHSGIHVQELKTEEEWAEFIACYQDKELLPKVQKCINNYRQKVQGHTLMMKMKIRNPEKEFKSIIDFKQGIFQRFPIKKESKQAMMYLSIMPSQGIPRSMFQKITQISDETIKDLENDLFIQKIWNEDWKEQMLFLHPIIAEAARLAYQPSSMNCGAYILGFKDYLSGDLTDGRNSWERNFEENKRLEPYVFAFMKAFPSPVPWLAEAFVEFTTLLWIQQYFGEAEVYAEKIWKSVVDYYGENHQLTGQMALHVAAVYYHGMNFDKARGWYLEALKILKTCQAYNQFHLFYLGQAYHKIARMYRHDGNTGDGLLMIEKSIRCLEQFFKNTDNSEEMEFYRQTSKYCLLEKGKLLFSAGQIEEAEKLYHKIMETINPFCKDKFFINEFYDFYIKLLVFKKEYVQAEELIRENLERSIHYRGMSFKDTLSCMEQLGDICRAQGKAEEALKVYAQIVTCLQKNYPYQKEWIMRMSKNIGGGYLKLKIGQPFLKIPSSCFVFEMLIFTLLPVC